MINIPCCSSDPAAILWSLSWRMWFSPSETSSQYQSWAAPRLLFLRHPALSACFPTSSICNILIPCPSVLLKPAGTFWVKKLSFIFFPQKYLLTGHRIFQKLQKLDMGGQVHMKRQKNHLPVYYSHKNPTKTLFLHEKKWVPAPWVSRFSVGISSLLT